MKDRYQILIDHDKNFATDRPVLDKFNNPDNLPDLLAQEVVEFREANQLYALYRDLNIDPNVIERFRKEAITEAADIAWFAFAIIRELGGDVFEEMMEKGARNHLKHPAHNYQDGSYKEARHKSRTEWTKEDEEDFYWGK